LPSSWCDDIYLSSDNVLDASDRLINGFSVNQGLPVGGNYIQTRTVYLPSVQTGDYYLILRADGDYCFGWRNDVIFETNETNNNRMVPIKLTSDFPICTPIGISSCNRWAGEGCVENGNLHYRLNIPQAERFYVTLQTIGLWRDGSSAAIKRDGQTIASVQGSNSYLEHDSILELKTPQAGEYTLEIITLGQGAMVKACTDLPIVKMDELFVGTIYQDYGYDWSQLDVPEGVGSLDFTVETVGGSSKLEVWRASFDSSEHWLAQSSGEPIRLTIPTPQPGRYYLRVWNHAILLSDSQVRDYSILVQTGQGTGEIISTPNMPRGPSSGMPSTSYTYSIGGSTSSLGHNIQYFFDCGDGTNSGWLPLGMTNASKSWASAGTYPVKAKGRCTTHSSIESNWSRVVNVLISASEGISAPNIPSGPINGIPGTGYSYSAWGSSSNLGHSIQYFFDWGDGTNSGWLSVDLNIASKSWSTTGTYPVKAKARCATDISIESSWSGVLPVTVTNTLMITGGSPNKGGNTGTVTVTFTGVNLDPDAQAKLTKLGEADIIPQFVTGSTDGTRLTATFDLTGKTPDIWNFVVTNSTGQSATLQNAFTIESGGEAKLWVEIVGRNQGSPGRNQTFMIRYGNAGSTDAEEVLAFLLLDPRLKYISGSSNSEYDEFFDSADWNLGRVPSNFTGYLNVMAKVDESAPSGTSLESCGYVVNTQPVEPQTAENLFLNGVNLQFDTVWDRKYLEFARRVNATWVPVYYTGSLPLDVIQVVHATPGAFFAPTDYNGLTQTLVTNQSYDTIFAYSGGTRTALSAIRLPEKSVKSDIFQ
jgi:hypothetical protein